MHRKMRRARARPRLQGQTEIRCLQHSANPARPGLQTDAFAAFGAPSVDDSAAPTGLHTHEETMRTGTADLRGLIGTFHDQSKQSEGVGRRTRRSPAFAGMWPEIARIIGDGPDVAPQHRTTRLPRESLPGKPAIITTMWASRQKTPVADAHNNKNETVDKCKKSTPWRRRIRRLRKELSTEHDHGSLA